MVESLDTVPNCVKKTMFKIAQEKGDDFTKEEQKKALAKSFELCRSDFSEDVLKIIDDLSVKSHFRQGKYVSQHERKLNEDKKSLGNILGHAIYLIEKKIKELEKELARAFKSKNQGEYNRILVLIDKKKGDVEKVKGELRKRGIIDMTEEQDLQDALLKIQKKIMDFEVARIRSDASIFKEGIAKAKENKQRSIFFRAYRPLETLNEVTKTSGKSSSSNIAGMEYSEGMLKVTFNWEGKGEVEYGYDVGPDYYDRMAKSQSKGKFLWESLRGKTPGHVIDNPRKMTPGGVGGSIVPYTKITKRNIQGDEFKNLQKQYAKQLKGKVKVVANMPFVRQKQKIISRQSKPYKGKASASDFYWFKISDLSDDVTGCIPTMTFDSIPIKAYTRNGKPVQAHERKGNKAEELKKKVRSSKIEKTAIPKGASGAKESKIEETFKKWQAERSGEKPEEKAPSKRRVGFEDEKRRKEIDKQARSTKSTPAPEPREEAIQKLIEETGMERKQAEERIAKLMGVTPKQAEKKAEVKEHEIKFKAENKELGEKLIALNQINAKLDSIPLKNIVMLFQKAFILIATKRDPEAILRSFTTYYKSLKSDKKMVINQKNELITEIGKIHKELITLSRKKEADKDFSVKAHFRKGKPVVQHEKKGDKNVKPLKQRSKKSYDKFEHKDIKKKIKSLDSTLKSLKKKKDSGDKEAGKNYSILLKYRNRLADKKFKLQGEILFPKKEDFEYISAAVDQCAKRAVAKSGGKGNYNSEVANCIRMIGISRRKAGLAPRPQGSQREQRRGARRAGTPARQERLREASENRTNYREARAEQARTRVATAERWAERAREVRVRITSGFIRNIGEVANYIAIGNYGSATQVLRDQFDKMHQIENDELRADIEQRLQQAARTLANRVDESNAAVLSRIRMRANTFRHYIEGGTLEDAARELSAANSESNRIFNSVGDQRRANALVFEMQQKYDERAEIDAGAERIRELNRQREARQAEAERERQEQAQAQTEQGERELNRLRILRDPTPEERSVIAAVQSARERTRQQRLESLKRRGRRNAESNASGLNEPEGGSVMHIEIPRPQHEIQPGVMASIPEGMEVRTRGFMRRYPISSQHYGERYWVTPSYRAIASGVAERTARRALPSESGTLASSRIETASQHATRSSMRSRSGPRIRWKMRISLGSRIFRSLDEIKRSDIREGNRLRLSVRAKKDYDFENPDFDPSIRETQPHEMGGNKRRIVIRKGRDVGGASFSIKKHRSTGLYLYLDLLKVEDASHRGRGASATALNPATMMADRIGLVVGGSPTPIDRECEVAPSHLSEAEKRIWRRNNSGQLDAMYASWGGVRNYEYGGSMARFPQTERIAGRMSDLKKRFDATPKLIFYNYPENLLEAGGEFFYYDPEKDMYYHLGPGGK